MSNIRKIRGDKENYEPEKTEALLWRVIGFDPSRRALVVEDPLTYKRELIYLSTGAAVNLEDSSIKVVDWMRNGAGEQYEGVKEVVTFVDPPSFGRPNHSSTCECVQCRLYKDLEFKFLQNPEVVDDFGQPGD